MSADIVGDLRRVEAERDALRAQVERVQALADEWEFAEDAICCDSCQSAVDARHAAADDLHAALVEAD